MPLTWNRPHVWAGQRCTRCGMCSDWPGAKHGCEGIEARDRTKAKPKKRKYDPVANAAWGKARRERLGTEAMRAEWRERARKSRAKRNAVDDVEARR